MNLVIEEHTDFREMVDDLVLLVCLARKERRVNLDLLDHGEKKDELVNLVEVDLKVIEVKMAILDSQANLE